MPLPLTLARGNDSNSSDCTYFFTSGKMGEMSHSVYHPCIPVPHVLHVQSVLSFLLIQAPSSISCGEPKCFPPLEGEEEEGKSPLSFLTF